MHSDSANSAKLRSMHLDMVSSGRRCAGIDEWRVTMIGEAAQRVKP
jgi:hypothetical protein